MPVSAANTISSAREGAGRAQQEVVAAGRVEVMTGRLNMAGGGEGTLAEM